MLLAQLTEMYTLCFWFGKFKTIVCCPPIFYLVPILLQMTFNHAHAFWTTTNTKVINIITRIGFSTKKTKTDVSPPPFGVRKIQMSLNTFSNWNNGVYLVNEQFHIPRRYLANAVNYCPTNPSFGKKLIILYYFHYNRKSVLHPITCTYSDPDKNSCKVLKKIQVKL